MHEQLQTLSHKFHIRRLSLCCEHHDGTQIQCPAFPLTIMRPWTIYHDCSTAHYAPPRISLTLYRGLRLKHMLVRRQEQTSNIIIQSSTAQMSFKVKGKLKTQVFSQHIFSTTSCSRLEVSSVYFMRISYWVTEVQHTVKKNALFLRMIFKVMQCPNGSLTICVQQ